MSKYYDGPAFPHDEIHDQMAPFRHFDAQPGMTLRDYFAAKAMQAMVASPGYCEGKWLTTDIARQSYDMAEAMLLERDK